MGLELVEANLQIEEEFGLSLNESEWEDLFSKHTTRDGWVFQFDRADATVAELCTAVNKALAEAAMPVPKDTFERVQLILADVSGMRVEQIQPKTFLMKDMEMG